MAMDLDEEVDLPWVEKYRPASLQDLIAHEAIVQTIQKFVDEKKLPHLLLYGPPGTGKTSTILAVAKQMYGRNYATMSLELNASDDRGINVVREQIKSFASTQQIMNRGVKLVILDEADSMTNAAQFALRRIIEKYTKTTRFCLVCNYVSKIIPALQSRCTRFRFLPLSNEISARRLADISHKENVVLTQDGLGALVEVGRGDMRKNLNILQSCAMSFQQIDANAVYNCTGNIHPTVVDSILEVLLTKSFNECFEIINEIRINSGFALVDIVRELHKRFMLVEFTEKMKVMVVKRMAELEMRLSGSTNEKLQLYSLIGAFIESRQIEE